VPASFDAVSEAARYGDLSRITLMASATVDPRLPPLFRETIYFFRDSVSSTQILGAKHLPITGATPTCVNMALSMAAFLGFTDMALFGADCGIRLGSDDHARDTVYQDIGLFQRAGELTQRYPVEVEGNFGGIARTNWIYDCCRLMLAEVIRMRALNAWNASDGAYIPGAVPRVSEAIEPKTGVIDHAALLATLKRSLNEIAPATIFAETDLAETARGAARLFDELERLLARLERGTPDFAGAYRAITDFLAAAGTRYERTEAIVSGTLVALPRIAMFFGFRVADPKLRAEIFSLFIREFKDTAKKMREETNALFDHLLALAAEAMPPRRALRA
jgi:hypothetical protein